VTAEENPTFPTEIVTEGKAKIIAPDLRAYGICPSDYAPSRAPVFYNPVMELNRDLTVIAFQVFQRILQREITICDPLTGTGIRSVRFGTEIEGAKKIVCGDINKRSFNLAKQNIQINGLENKVTVKNQEANRLLGNYSAPKERLDVIDIDPFGTPVPHLDSAVQALRNKGLLATTATDMAPLCGVHPKACIRKYGGKPLRSEYCQEIAIRLLTSAIATQAAKHDIGIHVLFSHCSNHYIRVYTQLVYGAKKADLSIKNLGYILHCFNCLHRETASKPFPETAAKCPECGSRMEYAGPLWINEIFQSKFVEQMKIENTHFAFKNSGKIAKLLDLIKDEASSPFTYYVLDRLSGKMRLPAPSVTRFIQALGRKGFKAIPTHFNTRGVRTDAPALVMQETLKELAKDIWSTKV
jgi:tRNA (guanine26-N2/guanine27-N2)-dimethyltransferase